MGTSASELNDFNLGPNPDLVGDEVDFPSWPEDFGAILGDLYHEVWNTRVPDDTNPMPTIDRIMYLMQRIKTAPAHDPATYVVLQSLGDSWAPIKADLYRRNVQASEALDSIRAEWSRRSIDKAYSSATKSDLDFEREQLLLELQALRLEAAKLKPKATKSQSQTCSLHKSASHTDAQCRAQRSGINIKPKTKPNTKAKITPDALAMLPFTLGLSPRAFQLVVCSRSNLHMVGDFSLLRDTVRRVQAVRFNDGTRVISRTCGTMTFGSVQLSDVLYVPGLKYSLVSIQRPVALTNGCAVLGWVDDERGVSLVDREDKIIFTAPFDWQVKLHVYKVGCLRGPLSRRNPLT